MNYKAAFLGDSGGSGDFVDWGVKCIGVGIEGGGEGYFSVGGDGG